MSLRTFGFLGTHTLDGGAYGIGRVTGSPMRDASVTTRFNVTDDLHPNPHNGVDLDDGLPDSEIICPLDGIVASNFSNVWPGPGSKTLYDFTTNGFRYTKVVQPGEYDRAGIVLAVIHEGPWLLPDGRVALNAVTTYCHLAELSPLPVGTRVKAGDVIGTKGTTGISTAPHLHWQLAFQFPGDGIFPPNMSDVANLTEPTQFIGLPVVDVTPTPEPLPGGEFLPEPDTLTANDLGRLYAYAVAGAYADTVTIRPVPSERANRRAFYVEV